ncbi:hypothetical protein BJX61DRAFT_129278 [Aspergillus egyptiacus]|nr:hypothetical protein BJX61DRAFT_129278 [Aspergillus egyptiacus]
MYPSGLYYSSRSRGLDFGLHHRRQWPQEPTLIVVAAVLHAGMFKQNHLISSICCQAAVTVMQNVIGVGTRPVWDGKLPFVRCGLRSTRD